VRRTSPDGNTNSACAPNGTGPLSDTNMRVPANGSVSYLLSMLVKQFPPTERIVTTASVSSVADPGPYSTTSTPTQIVIYRDGFEPYGDGASSKNPPADSFDAGVPTTSTFGKGAGLLLDLPLAPPTTLIDTVLIARGLDGNGFRIERLNAGAQTWVRAVTFDRDGAERFGEWIVATDGAPITISVVDDGASSILLLQDGTANTRITISSSSSQDYVITTTGVVQTIAP